MDFPNPAADLPPGSFGDVDTRDTHPVPGEEKRPPMPVGIGDGLFDGAQPELGKGIEAGVGGGIPGDVRRQSDGYQVGTPDNPPLDEAEAENDSQLPAEPK